MFELDLDLAQRRYGPEWVPAAAWYRSHALTVLTEVYADADVVDVAFRAHRNLK